MSEFPQKNVASGDLANRRLQPLGHSSSNKIKYLYVAVLAILTFWPDALLRELHHPNT
jgi:hypothetical protein